MFFFGLQYKTKTVRNQITACYVKNCIKMCILVATTMDTYMYLCSEDLLFCKMFVLNFVSFCFAVSLQRDLNQDMRAMLQKESMRTVERNSIYKSGVHEYSNYLVKQTKSWRNSSSVQGHMDDGRK